jgi:hypothetical protein
MDTLDLGPLAVQVQGLAANLFADLRESASVFVPDYFQEHFTRLPVQLCFGEEYTSWTKSECGWTGRFVDGVNLDAVSRVLASISANFVETCGTLAFHAVAVEGCQSGASVIVGPALSGKTSTLLRVMKTRTPLATNVCFVCSNRALLIAGTRTITHRKFEQSFALDRFGEIALPLQSVKIQRIIHLMPSSKSLMVVPNRDPFLLFNAASIIPAWTTLMNPRSGFQWTPSECELIDRGRAVHRLLDSTEQFQVTGDANEVADWIAST